MKKDILSLLLLFCGLSLYGQQYVSVSPSSISVPLGGGTYTCSVDYTISPDSLMSWDLARYTSTSSQVASLTGGWNKQFTVTFKANTGYTPVSGRLHTRYSPVRRSPSRYCYLMMPLDLHVLSLSLAFILSQDQTLHSNKTF